jgi:uncharacterized membrane protein
MAVTVRQLDRSPRTAQRAPRHAAARVRLRGLGRFPRVGGRGLGPYAAALALVAALVPLQGSWAVQMLLVLLLLTLPGVILLRALRIPGHAVASFPVYVPCASIVVLFGSGLAVDIVGPAVGVAAPLRAMPLLVGLELMCIALLAASVNAPADVAIRWRSLARPARVTWPLILPLGAAVGALRLNNGHGNAVAVIVLIGIAAMLVTAAARSSRLDKTFLEITIYAAGLAMIWSSSLRGDPIYGFDIATEYQRLEQTVLTGIWHTGHAGDAYGAMLSVTVMPTELHSLSGVSALLVFKAVYPMVYALFPVAIFGLARKVISRRWACVAAAFTIGQYAFPEIAGFARQEIALVLFAGLITAMLDTRIPRRSQWVLAALLGLAVALSHYSTTYVAITVIGLALLMQFGASWFRELPRVSGAMVAAFIATFAGAVIWYGPVTHSDSHLLQVAQTVDAQGLDILPNRAPGGSLLAAYLQGNSRTPISATQYAALIHSYYSVHKPYIRPLPDAGQPQYALRNSVVPEPPVKWPLGYTALTLGLLIIEQLANVLAAVGGLLMLLRRRTSVITRQIGLLALATTLLLTVLRFSGTLAVAYGQERAQLQGLVVLAVSMCWTMQLLSGKRKARQSAVLVATATCLAVVFINTFYLAGALLGGETSVNLANSGPAFEYFYTTAPEIASARWLRAAVEPGQLVYADEYGQVPLSAVDRIPSGLITDLTPWTLNQHAWVYASRTNVVDRQAFAIYNEHIATYVFPADFLQTNYNLVFTDHYSEVFQR